MESLVLARSRRGPGKANGRSSRGAVSEASMRSAVRDSRLVVWLSGELEPLASGARSSLCSRSRVVHINARSEQ